MKIIIIMLMIIKPLSSIVFRYFQGFVMAVGGSPRSDIKNVCRMWADVYERNGEKYKSLRSIWNLKDDIVSTK